MICIIWGMLWYEGVLDSVITARDVGSAARTTTVSLPHGVVHTPAFLPVATRAAIRGLEGCELQEMGYEMILANSYHLYLRPGHRTVSEMGGLHRFMRWGGNILTDSGGYQVFSLSKLATVREEGVRFRSHIDGSSHYFTPEGVMDIQYALGSDIIMPLDHCTAYGIDYRGASEAVQRSLRWLKASADYHAQRADTDAGVRGELFGIIQGNFFDALRTVSAEESVGLDLPGYAIGGLSVGEPRTAYHDMLAHTAQLLPPERPRYVMGVGTPDYMLMAIACGIDMFDCVYPTRVARNGSACTSRGLLNVKGARHTVSERALDERCGCSVCRNYSRAYLRHLLRCNEMVGAMLLTRHNLFFYRTLIEGARVAIAKNRFGEFARAFLSDWEEGDDG